MAPSENKIQYEYSNMGSVGIVLIALGFFSPRAVKWMTPYFTEHWQLLTLSIIGDLFTCGILLGIGFVIIGKMRNRKIDKMKNILNGGKV
jgi:glycopeptide antibiotics resistance protein